MAVTIRGQSLFQLLKFGIVGFLNTFVDYVLFVALVYGFGVPMLAAQLLSYGTATANSYYWNRNWTFRAKSRANPREAFRFFLLNAASLLAATAVLLILEGRLDWPAAAAKAGSVIVSVGVNYAGSRYWVFRRHALVNE